MREAMLIVHFLGLAMGLGTSFAFMFLGIAGSEMDKEEGKTFALKTFALGTMGHIGLVMLIISGLYLMTPYWGALSSMPLLIAKLLLVLVLTIGVIMVKVYTSRAKRGETESNLKKIASLGKVTLLSGIAIVLLAVLIFR